jgi:hypothetical protein
LSLFTSKEVKNGSMTGLISNGTLTQFFVKYFCLTWVADSFFPKDIEP